MNQPHTTPGAEAGRWAPIEWLAQHLRALEKYGVRIEKKPPTVNGKPLAAETSSRYHQTGNRIEIAGCALCENTRYARFATAQRNAFFQIGGYLLTGAESANADARRLHPRRERAETTAPELLVRNADGKYAALHHVLARFADRRLTLGHGPYWRRELERAMGPADLPGFASVERIGWQAPDARTARLAESLIDELGAALGPELADGPAATAEEAAEAESWRRWGNAARGLETRAGEGGLLCRRESPMSGAINVRLIPVSEAEIGRWARRESIQQAMPHLSADDREFLVSGTLPEEWDAAMEVLGADNEA